MFNKKLFISFLLFTTTISILSGCTIQQKSTSDDSSLPNIAVSIVPEASFVQAIAKDKVNIITMIPPGSNPENYEPTQKEIQAFSTADLFFSIGFPTEKNNLLPNLGDKTKVIYLDKEVNAVYPDLKQGDLRDPHIWLSPKRVMIMIDSIVTNLSKLDPNNQAFYKDNGERYKKKLTDLDQKLKNTLVPLTNRKFIVFHPAFGYLADDYGLQMYALEKEGKESTPEHLRKMIDLAKENQIKVIFYQAEMDSSQAKAFAEELGGETIQLEPLSPDYLENLALMIHTIAENMK